MTLMVPFDSGTRRDAYAQPPPEPLLELQPDKISLPTAKFLNFVLSPSLPVEDVKLTAYLTARSPGTDAGGDKAAPLRHGCGERAFPSAPRGAHSLRALAVHD